LRLDGERSNAAPQRHLGAALNCIYVLNKVVDADERAQATYREAAKKHLNAVANDKRAKLEERRLAQQYLKDFGGQD